MVWDSSRSPVTACKYCWTWGNSSVGGNSWDLPSVRFGCRLYVPTARLLELLGMVPEDR